MEAIFLGNQFDYYRVCLIWSCCAIHNDVIMDAFVELRFDFFFELRFHDVVKILHFQLVFHEHAVPFGSCCLSIQNCVGDDSSSVSFGYLLFNLLLRWLRKCWMPFGSFGSNMNLLKLSFVFEFNILFLDSLLYKNLSLRANGIWLTITLLRFRLFLNTWLRNICFYYYCYIFDIFILTLITSLISILYIHIYIYMCIIPL